MHCGLGTHTREHSAGLLSALLVLCHNHNDTSDSNINVKSLNQAVVLPRPKKPEPVKAFPKCRSSPPWRFCITGMNRALVKTTSNWIRLEGKFRCPIVFFAVFQAPLLYMPRAKIRDSPENTACQKNSRRWTLPIKRFRSNPASVDGSQHAGLQCYQAYSCNPCSSSKPKRVRAAGKDHRHVAP